jgi:hypothetical protein
VLCGRPSLGKPLPKRRPDSPFFDAHEKEVLNYSPELVLAQVGFHIVDDSGLDDRLVMVSRIDKVLQGRIHGVRGLNIGPQKNVAKVTANVPTL